MYKGKECGKIFSPFFHRAFQLNILKRQILQTLWWLLLEVIRYKHFDSAIKSPRFFLHTLYTFCLILRWRNTYVLYITFFILLVKNDNCLYLKTSYWSKQNSAFCALEKFKSSYWLPIFKIHFFDSKKPLHRILKGKPIFFSIVSLFRLFNARL